MDGSSKINREAAFNAASKITEYLFIARKEFRAAFQNMDDKEHLDLIDALVSITIAAMEHQQRLDKNEEQHNVR